MRVVIIELFTAVMVSATHITPAKLPRKHPMVKRSTSAHDGYNAHRPACVAQLDRASVFETEGRWFESNRVRF